MEKTELIKKVQELRKSIDDKKLELVKGALKDTSSVKKLRKELAAVLTKLSAMQHDA